MQKKKSFCVHFFYNEILMNERHIFLWKKTCNSNVIKQLLQSWQNDCPKLRFMMVIWI